MNDTIQNNKDVLLKNNTKSFDLNKTRKNKDSSSGFKPRGKTNNYSGNVFNKLEKEIIETKRVSKVTKGGRKFSFTGLLLIKDLQKNAIAYALSDGKEINIALRKAFFKAQKKLVTFFDKPVNTIDRSITVKFKSTTLFMKPSSEGRGIKTSTILTTFFKFLGIKDISAKIIGSRNKLNVIRAAFIAMSELTNKKYDH